MAKKSIQMIIELVELVESSVQSGEVLNDYSTLQEYCRELGLSSYTLNLLIDRCKHQEVVGGNPEIDHTFFIKTDSDDNPSSQESLPPVYEEEKGRKLSWVLFGIALLGCIILGMICLNAYNEKSYMSRQLSELEEQNGDYSDAMKEILKLADGRVSNESFSDWTSYNHSESSESHTDYHFHGYPGDVLSFNYFTSSESYDYLIITLSGEYTSTKELVKASGQVRSSRDFKIDSVDNYTLHVKYVKDSSVNSADDNAGISNVDLQRETRTLLDSIKVISNNMLNY